MGGVYHRISILNKLLLFPELGGVKMVKYLLKFFRPKVFLVLLFTLFGVIISNSYADISDDLFQAAFEGNTSKIEKLIKKGADVNAKDENGAPVLMAAAANGQTEIVKMLLDKGADVNVKDKDGKTALMRKKGTGTIFLITGWLQWM